MKSRIHGDIIVGIRNQLKMTHQALADEKEFSVPGEAPCKSVKLRERFLFAGKVHVQRTAETEFAVGFQNAVRVSLAAFCDSPELPGRDIILKNRTVHIK